MRHILFVDDDPAICETVQMGLELDGTSRVTCVLSAETALHVALHDRPTAAIIDAVLPKISGLALARTMIDMGIPVLITSGHPEHQDNLAEAGCTFLPKPFSLSRLLVETRVLLDHASERNARLAAGLQRMLRSRGDLAAVLKQTRRLVTEARTVVKRSRSNHLIASEGRPPFSDSRAMLLDGVIAEAITVTGADMGTLQSRALPDGALRMVASRGFGGTFLSYFAVVPASGESACGAALEQGRRVIVPDVTRSELFRGKPSGAVLRAAGVRAVQSTPVPGRDGRIIGMVATHRRSVWRPSVDELARLEPVIRRAAELIHAD